MHTTIATTTPAGSGELGHLLQTHAPRCHTLQHETKQDKSIVDAGVNFGVVGTAFEDYEYVHTNEP